MLAAVQYRLSSDIRRLTTISDRDRDLSAILQPPCLQQLLSEREHYEQSKQNSAAASYWKQLVSAVEVSGCRRQLKQLRRQVLQLLGGEVPPQLLDECTAIAVELLAGCHMLTEAARAELARRFVGISRQQADDLLQAVKDLTDEMSLDLMQQLMGVGSGSVENPGANSPAPTTEPVPGGADTGFGAGLRLGPLTDYTGEFDQWQLSESFVHSAVKNNNTNNMNQLSLFDGRSTSEADQSSSSSPPDNRTDMFGTVWLRDQLMCVADTEETLDGLVQSVYSLLCCESSSDHIQNELFELLGLDHLEMIGNILENREKIVAISSAPQLSDISNQIREKIDRAQKSRGGNLCGSVVVRTEKQVHAQRTVRREEKRLNRLRASVTTDNEQRGCQMLASKTQSEAALLLAMRSPLLGPAPGAGASSAPLPHVYDSYSAARSTSAFVAGCRISLPAECQWSDTKSYQSVEIPPSQPPPLDVGNDRVPISSLDQLGQAAFAGVQSLNRIQSVVFDTAYNSNENLLICAPTGAGKTNIAVLTILHQMRQHLVNNVLQLDQFKIVYVSPMKALAAEMTANFSRRLQSLGVIVRECTGDMQLSKQQILATQILVTTPEKWDVLSRKSDISLTQSLKLLIIDEVHLLHGDRGPVVEALVARTIRQVESSQSMIRIVGLSATLPNYLDVAQFLRVNPMKGLFFFDGRFRPVPLGQRFVGVRGVGYMQQMNQMDIVCYDEAFEMVSKGHQVMVFVHARNATSRAATALRDMAKARDQLATFRGEPSAGAVKCMSRARNKQLTDLFADGFSIHHAGLLRQDRSLVERLFAEGEIKVLCCTSTLAWGVNLPAHAVIIRGTDIYDASHGTFVDLGVLDVMQIFGRAGRPQFDTSGHGTIITTHAKLAHYLSLLTNQYPIESSFVALLADNLNAEVCLGTVSTVQEAIQWLTYTYLYVRMRKNPLVYGIKPEELQDDPQLSQKCYALVHEAATKLDRAMMLRYDLTTGYLCTTDQGRTASHFYVKYDTIEVVNEMLNPFMTYRDILAMLSRSSEFEQIKVRDEELEELDRHVDEDCEEAVLGGSENVHGKVNILLQTYISRGAVQSFSLVSDMNYIVQNATRVCGALYELCVDRRWPLMAGRVLTCCQQLQRRQWHSETPLRQCAEQLGWEVLDKLEQRQLSPEAVREMDTKELGILIRNVRRAGDVQRAAAEIPCLQIDASVQPITRRVLRVRITLTPDFRWNDRVHGKVSESFILWVEDTDNNFMYHTEKFVIQKKHVLHSVVQTLVFTVPVFEPMPAQYLVRVVSERWLGTDTVFPLSFVDLILPQRHPPQTNLLPLEPLPLTALNNAEYQSLYTFSHFNAVQTQIFHTLYHSDENVLLGAPTGSGKTIAAELAILRVFNQQPQAKVVYIAPMKALVRERISDWNRRLGARGLGRVVVELTGDVTPDVTVVQSADVIVTTPEKWDGISRSWQTRNYVQHVALLIIDEIHLLGEDRGPVLEVIVSRINYISSHTRQNVRIVGLSTAMANATDLADWLGINEQGLFNFRPSVRPVPLEVHIQGFPGKHYCPRMATMNKPIFKAIRTHSPIKPTLVFVSSRRQTRITALDLISCLAGEDDPKQWLHMDEHQLDDLTRDVHDQNLRLTLAFGIGIHHAGLVEFDRKLVEGLFVDQKIQVLVATATLAWGVNFPAHLVVVKGTEYYDGKTKRYVDFPVTDVLQMMGRAGRPQFDDQGVAVIMVHDVKKHFYKQFLYEPFPIESSLLKVLPDHLNAEIVSGSVSSRQDAIDYLTWTFVFRRILQNPSYYGLSSTDSEDVNTFLSLVVDRTVDVLQDSGCVEVEQDCRTVVPTLAGRIAAYYYINHRTVQRFVQQLSGESSLPDILRLLSDAAEYDEVPVRHNEEITNGDLASQCPLSVDRSTLDSPHTKTMLLLQAHFSRLPLPVSDYLTDQRSVLDQTGRLLQAILDLVAENGWLAAALRTVLLIQQIYQARWATDSPLLCLPHVHSSSLSVLPACLPAAAVQARAGDSSSQQQLVDSLLQQLDGWQVEEAMQYLRHLPLLSVELFLEPCHATHPSTAEKHRVPVTSQSRGRRQDADWLSVPCDTLCTLSVQLKVNVGAQRGEKSRVSLTPRYHKHKSPGWLLVLGEPDTAQLWALRRLGSASDSSVSSNNRQQHQQQMRCRLMFESPAQAGRHLLTLYVLSDCLLGVDQQYDVCINVKERSQ